MLRYSALGVLFLTLALFGFDGALPPSLAVATNGDNRDKPGDPPADPAGSRKDPTELDRQIAAREKELSERISAREKELSELKAKAAAWHDALANGFWKKAEPATLGLDPRAVERHRGHAQRSGADAVLVVYKGRIVSEWYSAHYREPIYTMSSVKSWTGLLVAMLIADGKIKSVDDPISDYLPEWKEEEKAKVTVRHLLTMTSGLKRRIGIEAGPDQSVGFAEPMDKNDFVRKLPLTYKPGELWEFSNEGVQLLSPLLDRAAGRPIQEYARDRLFKPVADASFGDCERARLDLCRRRDDPARFRPHRRLDAQQGVLGRHASRSREVGERIHPALPTRKKKKTTGTCGGCSTTRPALPQGATRTRIATSSRP